MSTLMAYDVCGGFAWTICEICIFQLSTKYHFCISQFSKKANFSSLRCRYLVQEELFSSALSTGLLRCQCWWHMSSVVPLLGWYVKSAYFNYQQNIISHPYSVDTLYKRNYSPQHSPHACCDVNAHGLWRLWWLCLDDMWNLHISIINKISFLHISILKKISFLIPTL